MERWHGEGRRRKAGEEKEKKKGRWWEKGIEEGRLWGKEAKEKGVQWRRREGGQMEEGEGEIYYVSPGLRSIRHFGGKDLRSSPHDDFLLDMIISVDLICFDGLDIIWPSNLSWKCCTLTRAVGKFLRRWSELTPPVAAGHHWLRP
ncbi:hypothetical protein ACH5RR_041728 [Cinchona calisaya]|uniref:Uncharacterized protein n=1 Tax=Cinchona calisaya TaxID=153742 RepID=A0ABD2XUD6_9GENT